MFLAEVFGILLAIELVQVFAGIGQFVGAADHQRVVGIVDDAFQRGHRLRVDDGSHVVPNEQQTGLGVIHDIMDLLGIKLVQDGHSDGTVGERSQESNGPLR